MDDTRAYPGFPEPRLARNQSHFAALAHSIVFQQLAGAAARSIHGRVVALTPGARFPNPVDFGALSDEALRGAGLSRGKLASLRDLSERCCDGRLALHGIGRLDDDAIIEHLTQVRGIGVWTAQMFLMFRLGRLDVMPAGDLGVQEGLRRLDGLDERPSPRELEARAQVWAPLRSVASWTLWRLTAP
jgi:DNA-3-methyladenine glycosylase II